MKTSVFLVQDEAGILQMLAVLLPLKFGCEVVGTARSAEEALVMIPRLKPDVVWVELRLGMMDGATLIRTLKLRGNEVKSVIFTGSDSCQQIKEAMACEPNAFVHKDDGLQVWERGLGVAAEGGVYISATIQKYRTQAQGTQIDQLTPCECSVFHLLLNGASLGQVTKKLGSALSTVRHHKEKIFAKLGVHSMDELLRFAARVGLLE